MLQVTFSLAGTLECDTRKYLRYQIRHTYSSCKVDFFVMLYTLISLGFFKNTTDEFKESRHRGRSRWVFRSDTENIRRLVLGVRFQAVLPKVMYPALRVCRTDATAPTSVESGAAVATASSSRYPYLWCLPLTFQQYMRKSWRLMSPLTVLSVMEIFYERFIAEETSALVMIFFGIYVLIFYIKLATITCHHFI